MRRIEEFMKILLSCFQFIDVLILILWLHIYNKLRSYMEFPLIVTVPTSTYLPFIDLRDENSPSAILRLRLVDGWAGVLHA